MPEMRRVGLLLADGPAFPRGVIHGVRQYVQSRRHWILERNSVTEHYLDAQLRWGAQAFIVAVSPDYSWRLDCGWDVWRER